MSGERICITGVVQGVGFRPFVWRLARECGIKGRVWNDGRGVVIEAWGEDEDLRRLMQRLEAETPPLAHIEAVRREVLADVPVMESEFRIDASREGEARTGVVADAAICSQCLAEIMDPVDRRYRYPFTNCTHCGPRLSIVHAIPYDRTRTSMAAFPLCPRCRAEYEDPADRRFHAQPNACGDCGPRLWLEDAGGQGVDPACDCDVIETAARLIRQGYILAIKGVGGFHLVCDAGDAEVVDRLRQRKGRCHKALALMARDVAMVRRYARLSGAEAALLQDRAAPIIVLDAAGEFLAPGVAPGQNTLGFMLPYTPLHHLLMAGMDRPVVMTSGNRSDEPQVIDNGEARLRLHAVADYFLLHDRDIVNRLDDSVVRVMAGRARVLRRARGYVPQAIPLPPGVSGAGSVLAMGGELKNTFCLVRDGQAVLSQHMGDLEDGVVQHDYRRNLAFYERLFDHVPTAIAVDRHPGYLSTRLGRALAAEGAVSLFEVQHHHAHIAACLADNGVALGEDKVMGVALDGLGLGEDGTLWGGEFLLAGYHGFERLAHFEAVPMPGGAQAVREPWRNTLAHLHALGWEDFMVRFSALDIVHFLMEKPLPVLRAMMEKGINSPAASSCGRLFDAVAAALGVCRDGVTHEGQAAMELEALAAREFRTEAPHAYPFDFQDGEVGVLAWRPLWEALLADQEAGIASSTLAARFHQGLAQAVARTAELLCDRHGVATVALGGGVFHNRLLLEGVSERLASAGLRVLSPHGVPAGDGGLALGQAVVAAVRLLDQGGGT